LFECCQSGFNDRSLQGVDNDLVCSDKVIARLKIYLTLGHPQSKLGDVFRRLLDGPWWEDVNWSFHVLRNGSTSQLGTIIRGNVISDGGPKLKADFRVGHQLVLEQDGVF